MIVSVPIEIYDTMPIGVTVTNKNKYDNKTFL